MIKYCDNDLNNITEFVVICVNVSSNSCGSGIGIEHRFNLCIT